MLINSLSSNNYLNLSKLKAFGDDKKKKKNVTEKIEICLCKGKKHCGKRRTCW